MGSKTNSFRAYFVDLHTGALIELADLSDMVTIDRRSPQTVTPIVPLAQFQLTIPLKEEDYIKLKEMIENNTPALVICGIYQLFGNYFETNTGQKIQGAGILDLYTKGEDGRLIGNVVINTPEFGEVVGYENHSGQTFLADESIAFGTVISGAGNNGKDFTEGIKYHNCIGTYLHGPILPKNPRVADFLIRKALENKTKKFQKLEPLNDALERKAHKSAAKRPR